MNSKNWLTLPRKASLTIVLLCIGYILFRWGQFAINPDPQDFHIYYYSVIADEVGGEKYTREGLKQVSNGRTKFLYVYPPYALTVFKPFTWLSEKNGARAFLIIKTLAFTALFWIWLQFLAPANRRTDIAFLLLLSAVGYYECTYTDFKNGNISVFEQLFLWSGILLFCRGKYAGYALFVFLASFFKLALIPFLGALIFVPKKKGLLPMFVAGLGFIGLQVASYANDPAEYLRFLTASTGLVETGPLNPSTMMLSRATFGWLGEPFANGIYGVIAFTIVTFFARLALKNWNDSTTKKLSPFVLMVGFCFMYTIVMPRFKNYSFVMLIFPTYWMMQNFLPQKKWLFWTLIVLLVAHVAPYQTWAIAAFMLGLWFYTVGGRQIDKGDMALSGTSLNEKPPS